MTKADECQGSKVLAEVAGTMFYSVACKIRGLLNGPTFEGREWAQSDEAHQAYLVKLERLKTFRAGQALPRTPELDELIELTLLQFRAYDEGRQVRLTSLRKKIWREQKPTEEVQMLLFLCEVPRIQQKKFGAPREAGIFMTSRGERERDGRPCLISEDDRIKGIEKCLKKAHRAAGWDRPIGEILDEAAARSLTDHNVMQGNAAA